MRRILLQFGQMKRLTLFLLGVAFVMPPVFARDVVGEIVYLEGFPEIIRGADTVIDTVDFGFPIENYDSIRTDPESVVELQLDRATGIDATISVEPDTVFHINVSSLQSEQTGTVDLISGSISVVARELLGVSRLNVRTQTSVAGVRGTTFSVTTAVGGEILVSAQEGLVEVTDLGGATLFAAPGEAVELDSERNVFRNLKYTGSPAALRRQWLAERIDAFRANAPRVFRFYARRYLAERDAFVSAYEALMAERDIIDRWIEEDRRGITADSITVTREKRQIAGALLRLRASMFLFEHTVTRLDRMRPLVVEFADEIEVARGDTATDLLKLIELERAVMTRRFATVRQVLRLFSDRNNGQTPLDIFGRFEGVDLDRLFGERSSPDAGE